MSFVCSPSLHQGYGLELLLQSLKPSISRRRDNKASIDVEHNDQRVGRAASKISSLDPTESQPTGTANAAKQIFLC